MTDPRSYLDPETFVPPTPEQQEILKKWYEPIPPICTDPASDPKACDDCLEADRCPNLEPFDAFLFSPSDRPYPVMYQSVMPVLTAAAARYDMAREGIART